MNWKLGLTDQIIFQSFVFQHLIGTLKYPHKNPGGRFKITYISSEEIDCVNKRHTGFYEDTLKYQLNVERRMIEK